MIRGIITNCGIPGENGRRSIGLANVTTAKDAPILTINFLLDYPLTNKDVEDLQHLLGKRVTIHQDDKSPRPPRRTDHIKKLKFRG